MRRGVVVLVYIIIYIFNYPPPSSHSQDVSIRFYTVYGVPPPNSGCSCGRVYPWTRAAVDSLDTCPFEVLWILMRVQNENENLMKEKGSKWGRTKLLEPTKTNP